MDLLRFALLGLGASGAYAILALGMTVIYRGSGVINFAHGATGMCGAYLVYEELQPRYPEAPVLLLLLAGVLCGGLLSSLQYLVVMRSARHSSPLTRLVATLGVMLLLQSLAALRYGNDNRYVRSLLPSDSITLTSGAVVPRDQLIVASIAAALTLILWAAYRFSLFGLATLAVAENVTVAEALGWRPERVALANWFLGGCLGGLGGVLITPFVGLQVVTLSLLVVTALAAGLVGGLKSFPLALVGAAVIGVGQSEVGRFVDIEGAPTAVPLIVVLLVLITTGRNIPLRGDVLDRLPRVGSGRAGARGMLVAGVAMFAAIWVVRDVTWLNAITASMIAVILLLSIVVLTGYAGQVSLAQWAMAGLGAFVAGRLVATTDTPFLLALLLAMLAALPVGIAFSLPAVRTRGASLAIATLSMGMAAFALLFNVYDLTGGSLGTVLGMIHVGGFSLDPLDHPARYATFVLVVLGLAMAAVSSIRRSHLGLQMLAVRSDERVAGALGIDVVKIKVWAFVVAAMLASCAGVLTVFQGRAILYTRFDVTTSILIVAFCVIGGVGYIWGAVMGSLFAAGGLGALIFAQIDASEEYLNVVAATVVLLNVIANPDGIAGTVSQYRKGRRRPDRPAQRLRVSDAQPAAVAGGGLEASKLSVSYGSSRVLTEVNLVVQPGEVVGVIGPNGAGKTTLIDALTGFAASAGHIILDGRRLERMSVHQRVQAGLSRSFQSADLIEDLTIAENLAASTLANKSQLAGLRPAIRTDGTVTVPQIAVDAMEALGLSECLDKVPTELSVGERRLCGVVRALASSPRVVMLDEPAAGLDEGERNTLVRVLRDLASRGNVGVLLIEHNVGLVSSACDRVYAVDRGGIICEGRPVDVVSSPAVIESYLGPGKPALEGGLGGR